jgi:FAD/FMN-containing dehydrogenase
VTQQVDQPAASQRSLDALRSSFRGELLNRESPGYEERRRVWNGSIDRRPSVIARCASPADVRAAVGFARDEGLLVAVRSGGHSLPGHSVCDDGMVIDLGPMKGVRVDPEAKTVRAQAGLLLGELDRETHAFGLGVPAGIVTHTGMAGLTLGGGIGWRMRKHGLTIDHLLSVDVITADGEFVKASASENADLFWGIRGGGGNFGIVTDFEFRLTSSDPYVVGGFVVWPMEDAPEVIRFYRDWVAESPDELTSLIFQRRMRAGPGVPDELVGRRILAVAVCYAGDIEEGERFIRPLKAFGSPVLDACRPMPFLVQQTLFDPSYPHGWWYYFRACDVAELSDAVIDVVADYGMKISSPITTTAIWQMGGAVNRVPEDATAFNGRSAGFTFNLSGNTETADGFDAERQWTRDYWDALAPYHTSVYVNFLMDEGEQRIREAYGKDKYDRLKALKRRYDPGNFFRLNQNIRPD